MEERKNGKGLVVLITVLVLIILGLTGFIVYDKVLKKEKVESGAADNGGSEEKTNNGIEEGNINTVKSVELTEVAKEELDKVIFHLSNMFYRNEWLYDTEYFDDNDFKFSFAWADAVSNIRYSEINQYGEEETGSIRFYLDTFKHYYKRIINEELDITKLNKKSNFYKIIDYPVIKDGDIYGSYPTGFEMPDDQFKFNSLIYDQKAKEYTIKMDWLKVDRDVEDLKATGETAYLKYQLDDVGNRIYTSFIVKK